MAGTCYCLDTYRAGNLEGAANVNIITCSRLQWLSEDTRGLKYHASIPLYAYEKKFGVLNVASTNWRELSPEDLRLLYTVGDMLSIAIERARLFARSVELGTVEERNRLAREIHDTLAQGLAGIALKLEAADALLDSHNRSEPAQGPERAHEMVRQALSLTQVSLEEARRSVLDLRAAPLEGKTLAEALKKMAGESTARGRIQVHFKASGPDRHLPLRIEAGLYRVAQEAIENIIRHANARQASLKLEITPAQVHLVITDDGKGFNPAPFPPGRYGLLGLKERVKLLKGDFQIRSEPGSETVIEVSIPIIPRLASQDKKV